MYSFLLWRISFGSVSSAPWLFMIIFNVQLLFFRVITFWYITSKHPFFPVLHRYVISSHFSSQYCSLAISVFLLRKLFSFLSYSLPLSLRSPHLLPSIYLSIASVTHGFYALLFSLPMDSDFSALPTFNYCFFSGFSIAPPLQFLRTSSLQPDSVDEILRIWLDLDTGVVSVAYLRDWWWYSGH